MRAGGRCRGVGGRRIGFDGQAGETRTLDFLGFC